MINELNNDWLFSALHEILSGGKRQYFPGRQSRKQQRRSAASIQQTGNRLIDLFWAERVTGLTAPLIRRTVTDFKPEHTFRLLENLRFSPSGSPPIGGRGKLSVGHEGVTNNKLLAS